MLQKIAEKFRLSPLAERILFDTSLIVLILSIFFMFLIIFWLLQPSKILTIYNEPIPTLHDGATPGNTVIFVINYCKSTSDKGYVTWEIVGQNSVTLLPSYMDNTEKSCNKQLLDPVVVPPELKPGIYYIVWQVTYPVNPLKKEYTEFRSRDFTINK
jgi:hypothetical protein